MRPEIPELSVAAQQKIDRQCINFEDCWRNGDSPRLEDYLSNENANQTADLFRELLLVELAYLRQQQKSPAAEDYLKRFPQYSTVVEQLLPPPATPLLPRYQVNDHVGRYTIEGQLGSGAFGTVYLARDDELNRLVALKSPAQNQRFTEDDIVRFIDEARLAAGLDHEGIVRIFDVFRTDDGSPAIVMQYIQGQSLRERLGQGKVSLTFAVDLLVGIAEAIDYAHRNGVVHRDLEPRNILLDQNHKPYVSDFGLAIHESNQSVKAGESAGSLAYMSPEQVLGDSHWLDGRSDIWAMGVIMYELLVGRRPFVGRDVEELTTEILARDPKPLRQIDANIPAELERICLQCLSKSQTERFATAQDFADALRFATRQQSPSVLIASASRRRHQNFAIVTTLAIAAAFSWFFWNRHSGAAHANVENIAISIWDQNSDFRGRISRTERQLLPIRAGDQIRLDVELERPMVLYLLWIGTDGEITPIYPWRAGDWESTVKNVSATRQLSLPANSQTTWKVKPGAAGTESIVLLVSPHTLPSTVDIRNLLHDIQPQTKASFPGAHWFENGQWTGVRQEKQRSPNVAEPVALEDPVVLNQKIITERLAPYSVQVFALTIAIAES